MNVKVFVCNLLTNRTCTRNRKFNVLSFVGPTSFLSYNKGLTKLYWILIFTYICFTKFLKVQKNTQVLNISKYITQVDPYTKSIFHLKYSRRTFLKRMSFVGGVPLLCQRTARNPQNFLMFTSHYYSFWNICMGFVRRCYYHLLLSMTN